MELPVEVEEKHHEAPVVYSQSEILEKRAAGEISSREGMSMLQVHLKHRFPQERIASMIDDLCRAQDTRMGQFGKYNTPNWLARDKGLEKVMKLLSMTPDGVKGTGQAPTRMVFNIISNSPVTVEQKESSEGA